MKGGERTIDVVSPVFNEEAILEVALRSLKSRNKLIQRRQPYKEHLVV